MTLDNMTGITEGSYTGFCKSQLITCNRVKECNGVCPFEDALKHADKTQTENIKSCGVIEEEQNALPSAEPKWITDSEWIPCSERLPIPPTFCLVTTDGSHGDVIDIALYMSDGWHKASEVIAWMPLPKPYNRGAENETSSI